MIGRSCSANSLISVLIKNNINKTIVGGGKLNDPAIGNVSCREQRMRFIRGGSYLERCADANNNISRNG